MNKTKAVRIAIAAMREEIRRLNVEANLFDMLGADHPAAVSASKKRKEIKEAIAVIETDIHRRAQDADAADLAETVSTLRGF